MVDERHSASRRDMWRERARGRARMCQRRLARIPTRFSRPNERECNALCHRAEGWGCRGGGGGEGGAEGGERPLARQQVVTDAHYGESCRVFVARSYTAISGRRASDRRELGVGGLPARTHGPGDTDPRETPLGLQHG